MRSNTRLYVSILAVALPLICLIKGRYGSFLFSFSVPLFWQVSYLGKPFSSLGLSKESFVPSVITGFITGIGLALVGGNLLTLSGVRGAVFAGPHILNSLLQRELGFRLLALGNTLAGTILYLFFCVFLVGLGEELFWRGFIQQKISIRLSKNMAIWLTAILFGLVHFYIFTFLSIKSGIFFLGLIALAGAFWGYLFERFHNIWGPAIAHGLTAFIIWKYFFFSP